MRGSISFPKPCPLPEEVIAVGPSQVSLEFPFRSFSGLDQSGLGGLCPGQWTITVRGGGEALATAKTEILGTETVRIELAAEPKKQP